MKKKVLIAVAVLAAAGAATYFVLDWLTTDEQRVARVVHRLAGRIEARDPLGLCELLTEDYQDANGFDRLSLRALLTRGLVHLAHVSVRIDALEVTVNGDESTAEFTGYVTAEARDHGQQPPWHHQSLVRLRLRKGDGKWLVRHAQYALPELVRREAF